MDQRPRDRLATYVSARPDELRGALADTLSALVGGKVELEPYDGDDAALTEAFSEAEFFVVPFAEGGGGESAGLLALDARAATRCGGALAMLSPEELAEAEGGDAVPEKAAASLGEAGKLLVGALSKLIVPAGASGHPELSAADEAERRSAGAWPDLLAPLGEDAGAVWAGYGLALDGKGAGRLLVAAAGVPAEDGSADPSAPASLDGAAVRCLGRPGDPAQVAMGELLESLGARVLSMHAAEPTSEAPVAAFVVSRSPADLRVRMESLGAVGQRPALVVACSDRPTRDLVLTARQAGADDFLVLPASRERVLALVARVLQPA